MNECLNEVIMYGDKDQVIKVKDLFNVVLDYGWVYDYYTEHDLQWPSFVNTRFYLDSVSDVTYSEKHNEWFVKIDYTSPFSPFFSIIQNLLDTIDTSNIKHVLYSIELNSELFINTDIEDRYFPNKYYVCIDITDTNDDIEKQFLFTGFYATDIQDLCSKFQKQCTLLLINTEFQTIDSYETLTKAIEYLKNIGVYINILHSTSIYNPEQELDTAKNIETIVNDITKGE